MSLLRWLAVSLCVGSAIMAHAAPSESGIPVRDEPAAATTPSGSSTSESVETRQAALKQRVMDKWDALIRHDFAAAYALTSPAYRQQFSLGAFKRQFATGKIVWQRVEVADVDFKGDDAAKVGIKIHFVYYPPQAEKAINMANYVQESWVRSDGQWWYLAKE